MPSAERARHIRMTLRHSKEMKDALDTLYPKVDEILRTTATANDACCTLNELSAASRYLARTLAEYDLRRRKPVRDARYNPEDEAYWREDRALIEALDSDPSAQQIAEARLIRKEYRQWSDSSLGGARHALVNAFRHAWLICHDGSECISYGRQTDKHGEHCGPLHDFIASIIFLIPVSVNTDSLHREIRALDLLMHPDINVP